MGCYYSRLEREDLVSRCKGRKRYMKQFVKAINDFSVSHTMYLMFLRNTGSAHLQFATIESLLLHHYLTSSSSSMSPSSGTSSLPPTPPPPSSSTWDFWDPFMPRPPHHDEWEETSTNIEPRTCWILLKNLMTFFSGLLIPSEHSWLSWKFRLQTKHPHVKSYII